MKMRMVVVRGNSYLRTEDVVAYLSKLAGGGETDTRKRIESGVNQMTQVLRGMPPLRLLPDNYRGH